MSLQKLFVCHRVALVSEHVLWKGKDAGILPVLTTYKYKTLHGGWTTHLRTWSKTAFSESFKNVSNSSKMDCGRRNLLCQKLDKDVLARISRSPLYVQSRWMAGHSHWANIKHQKSRSDFLKSLKFQKATHDLIVCAKEHGVDPKKNTKLAKLISETKKQCVPNEVIERALKKAAGRVSEKLIMFEGRGPSGSTLLIWVKCDKHATAKGAIQNTLKRNFSDGGLQSRGSSKMVFDCKGIIIASMEEDMVDTDRHLEVAIDVGAEEVTEEKDDEGNSFVQFVCDPAEVEAMKSKIEKHNVRVWSAEEHYIPLSMITITPEEKRSLIKTINKLKSFSDYFILERITTNIENFDPDEAL